MSEVTEIFTLASTSLRLTRVAKLDDPVATARGSDTDSLGAGHERLRQRAGIVYGDAVTVRSVGGSEDQTVALRRYGGVTCRDV